MNGGAPGSSARRGNKNAYSTDFLSIDVQGAEALVLKGAMKTLRYIDAVSIEVNFTDLYEGCAQIEDIENMFRAVGFRRAALISAYHPSWADAVYIRMHNGREIWTRPSP
jgi:hypothetical protein